MNKLKRYKNDVSDMLWKEWYNCIDITLFGWLVSQPAVSANQPTVLFSHTKSAPASNYQPASNIFLSQ